MANFFGIACVAANRVIGKDNSLPWKCSEDLKFFKNQTLNGNVIMGRKTWEGMGIPYLKGRNVFVLSSQNHGWIQVFGKDNTTVNIFSKFEELPPEFNYWVAGGLSVYNLFMPQISEFYISYLSKEYEGDTLLPDVESNFQKNEELLKTDELIIKKFYEKKAT